MGDRLRPAGEGAEQADQRPSLREAARRRRKEKIERRTRQEEMVCG